MKPIYNLTEPAFDLHEWAILSQSSLENIPVPQSYVLTKEAFKIGIKSSELSKQIKVVYDRLLEDSDTNINIYSYSPKGYSFHLSRRGFQNFLDDLEKIYNDAQSRRDDEDFSVLLQKNITSESSGILFTTDPETNNPNLCTIEAIYGQDGIINQTLGETDRYAVDKHQEIIADKFVIKQEKMTIVGSGESVTEQIDISPRWQTKQKLDDRHILMLMEIARYLEENFEKDLEVRWIYEGGKIYILNVYKREPLVQMHNKIQDADELDLNKIIDEAPEIEIIPATEEIKEPIIETKPKMAMDYVPHFLKSESEVGKPKEIGEVTEVTTVQATNIEIKLDAQSEKIEKREIQKAPEPEPIAVPQIEAEKPKIRVEPVNIETHTPPVIAKTVESHEVEAQKPIDSVFVKEKEELLIKGIGIQGGVLKGAATKNIHKNANILVTENIDGISKKEAIKFEGFVVDSIVENIPSFLEGKIIISASHIGTKLIKEDEILRIDGRSGNIYELQIIEEKPNITQEEVVEPRIEDSISKETEIIIEEIEVKVPLVQTLEMPVSQPIVEEKKEVFEEEIVKTASKILVKSIDEIPNDSDNYDGFSTSIKVVEKLASKYEHKTVLVQMTNNIEADSSLIKSLRTGGNKNIWVVLPKTRKFSELEEFRKDMSNLRRSANFKIFGLISTPANALSISKYIEYTIDGIYIDLFKLKSSLIDDDSVKEYKSLGATLQKCLKEIADKTKKKKFTIYLDLEKFEMNVSIVNKLFEMGFVNFVAAKEDVLELKKLLASEEKGRILKHIRGAKK